MLKNIEKNINNWLIDRIIGGSYLGEYRPIFFAKMKKIGGEAYTHILLQREKLKKRYRD